MRKNTMKKGQYVLTPRFCTVKIDKVFRSQENAAKAGYTEPTYYKDYDFGVVGKSTGLYTMTFAAYRK